jgi:hypothetical protein
MGLFNPIPEDFTSLDDTPTTYSGTQYFFLKVNDDRSGVVFAPVEFVDIGMTTASGHGGEVVFFNESENILDFKNLSFLELTDTPTTYSGGEEYVVSVKSDGTGVEYTTLSGIRTSEQEKFIWQIKLAKIRPSFIYTTTSNFTPSGYDVYPILPHNWRAGTSSEYEHGGLYPNTVVIKDGTPINLASDGFMMYVRSTDVHSTSDAVQNDNPKMEYFKRLKYIQSNDYEYISAYMSRNAWNTQTIPAGTNGSLLISYTFDNVREFAIYVSSNDRHIYHGNYQTDGTLGHGLSRHEDMFFIPIDFDI